MWGEPGKLSVKRSQNTSDRKKKITANKLLEMIHYNITHVVKRYIGRWNLLLSFVLPRLWFFYCCFHTLRIWNNSFTLLSTAVANNVNNTIAAFHSDVPVPGSWYYACWLITNTYAYGDTVYGIKVFLLNGVWLIPNKPPQTKCMWTYSYCKSLQLSLGRHDVCYSSNFNMFAWLHTDFEKKDF